MAYGVCALLTLAVMLRVGLQLEIGRVDIGSGLLSPLSVLPEVAKEVLLPHMMCNASRDEDNHHDEENIGSNLQLLS
jgi:hypothetical protein